MSRSPSAPARLACVILLALAAMAVVAGLMAGQGGRGAIAGCVLASVLVLLALVIAPPPFWPESWRLPHKDLLTGGLGLVAAGLTWHFANYAAFMDANGSGNVLPVVQDVANIQVRTDALTLYAAKVETAAPARAPSPDELAIMQKNTGGDRWSPPSITTNWSPDPVVTPEAEVTIEGILTAASLHPASDLYSDHVRDTAALYLKSARVELRGGHLSVPLSSDGVWVQDSKGLPASAVPFEYRASIKDAKALKALMAEPEVTLRFTNKDGKPLIVATIPLDHLNAAVRLREDLGERARRGDFTPRYSLFQVYVGKTFFRSLVNTWQPDPH